MELWESGQDLLGSNVLDGHKWDKYCLDDSFVSHLHARIPCGGYCSLPGRWKEAGDDIISVAHRNRCILLIGVQMFFFFPSLYLLNFGTRGDGEEKHGRLQALLCHCQENAHFAPVLTLHKPEGKDALLANFSLHQHSFHSKAQNNISSKVLWKGFSNLDAKDPNISFPHEKHAKSFLWLIQFKFICIAFVCSF